MKNSKIEWTNHTWNIWRGCTKKSPGCKNCYAETMSKRAPEILGNWGKGAERIFASKDYLRHPYDWDAQARLALNAGTMLHRPRVFCLSLGDWLDDEVQHSWRWKLLHTIKNTPNLDWLLLTKDPQNFHYLTGAAVTVVVDEETEEWANAWRNGSCIPDNVWLGTSVENQEWAKKRVPILLDLPACVHFLSCEPLLGQIDLSEVKVSFPKNSDAGRIDWVIVGGESGPKHRDMKIGWARHIIGQCLLDEIPVFVKQDAGIYPGRQGRFTDEEWTLKQFPSTLRRNETPEQYRSRTFFYGEGKTVVK